MTKADWISRAAAELERNGERNPVRRARQLLADHDDGEPWDLTADYNPELCVREEIAEESCVG